MTQKKIKTKVALKYCGSCNPQIDLRRIADYLTRVARRRPFKLMPLSGRKVDIIAILCGCPRACGNKAEVRARAKHCLVVAGESLDGKSVAEANLPIALEEALTRVSGHKEHPRGRANPKLTAEAQ